SRVLGGGAGKRARVLKPRGQGIYARILRFGFAGPDSRRPDSNPASSLGLSRLSRSEERRSSWLMTFDPRAPAKRGERRYLVKQRKRAVYRRVIAVQLFNEVLDHLGAPPCFCLLSRDLSPPCPTPWPGDSPSPVRLHPQLYHGAERDPTGEARNGVSASSPPGFSRSGVRHRARRS